MASAAPLVTVTVRETGIAELADPRTMLQAEAEMIERGVDILEPLARSMAPRRTGRGARFIRGVVERQTSGHLLGRVGPIGKGFYLRILATGARAHEESPFRFTSRRGISRRARLAARALGPGGARGAVRALRFQIGGTFFFRRTVRHPGLKPDLFLERAARAGEPRVAAAADAVVVRHLGGRVA